jgi:integrase
MRLKLYRGSWYAVWADDAGTRRAALRTKDRGLAEQRLADLIRCPAGETVADFHTAYIEDLAARNKPTARAAYAWKALGRTFGALRPDQVDAARCRAYAAERRLIGRSDGTIAKELGCLRAALRGTAARVELPPRPPARDRRLTRAEYRRLRLAAKPVFHIYLFIVLGLSTAGRRQALLDLTWDRVDFGRGLIYLYGGGKGKGRATVPMARNARRVLALAFRMRSTRFVIEYAGRPVGSVKKGFAAACDRAGLEGVTPHVLRHTAASWMAEGGISMAEIAQFLGHSDSRITERIYARFSPDYLRRAANALDRQCS